MIDAVCVACDAAEAGHTAAAPAAIENSLRTERTVLNEFVVLDE